LIRTLNEENYAKAIEQVCRQDADLCRVVERLGNPPLWARPAGFAGLIQIILEQQVSVASARAVFEKLNRRLGAEFTPENFLRLSSEDLKTLGFSRQKTLYASNLAQKIAARELNLPSLEFLEDAAVTEELTKLKGIGRWTADIYLLMCLRRADAFPIGDLGVIVGAQIVKNLSERPTLEELEKIGEQWRPFRAVATRILWHSYLNRSK
jgi:DNA-3-methyladenine glycosylase II